MINVRATNAELTVCGTRILAVTPRAPRTQVDSVVAEIVIMIGELCETFNQAQELTEHLVRHPQPRWNFQALKEQAIRFMNPPAPPPPAPPNQVAGFTIPDWLFEHSPKGYTRLAEFYQAVEAEIWRRIQSWTPQRRQQLEDEVKTFLAEFHRGCNGRSPFENPTPEQIRHYMIVKAGHENAAARAAAGSLEPCPIAEHPPAPESKPVKVRPKTRRP